MPRSAFSAALPPCALLLALFLSACAEEPDGTIVVNERTIENFFEGDREGLQSFSPPLALNLLHDQPVMRANVLPPPPGQVRLRGVLSSAGPYKTAAPLPDDFPGAASRGSTFSDSVYGRLGPAGKGGNAWFYADIVPETGAIVSARAYLYNFMDGVCDMRQAPAQGYGSFSPQGFALYIDGPCLFPQQPGSTVEFALIISGPAISPDSGESVPVRYMVTDSATLRQIPANPEANANVYDFGSGKASFAR